MSGRAIPFGKKPVCMGVGLMLGVALFGGTLRYAAALEDGEEILIQQVQEMSADGWVELSTDTLGYMRDGMLLMGWQDINESKYYFDEDGSMFLGRHDIQIDEKMCHYYFRPSGIMATGWADIDGVKYWFRPSGNMATGWVHIDGKKYCFADDGHMLQGWQEVKDEHDELRMLYFRPSGSLATGWATMEDDSKRFFDETGSMLKGWVAMEGKCYYFDDEGKMLTGEQTIDESTYYFRSSGILEADAMPDVEIITIVNEPTVPSDADAVVVDVDPSDGVSPEDGQGIALELTSGDSDAAAPEGEDKVSVFLLED